MELSDKGGFEIYFAAKKPKGEPKENWLPLKRKGEGMDITLRMYMPDLEKMKTWEAPEAEMVKQIGNTGR